MKDWRCHPRDGDLSFVSSYSWGGYNHNVLGLTMATLFGQKSLSNPFNIPNAGLVFPNDTLSLLAAFFQKRPLLHKACSISITPLQLDCWPCSSPLLCFALCYRVLFPGGCGLCISITQIDKVPTQVVPLLWSLPWLCRLTVLFPSLESP